jgi:hypothetical protein
VPGWRGCAGRIRSGFPQTAALELGNCDHCSLTHICKDLQILSTSEPVWWLRPAELKEEEREALCRDGEAARAGFGLDRARGSIFPQTAALELGNCDHCSLTHICKDLQILSTSEPDGAASCDTWWLRPAELKEEEREALCRDGEAARVHRLLHSSLEIVITVH